MVSCKALGLVTRSPLGSVSVKLTPSWSARGWIGDREGELRRGAASDVPRPQCGCDVRSQQGGGIAKIAGIVWSDGHPTVGGRIT